MCFPRHSGAKGKDSFTKQAFPAAGPRRVGSGAVDDVIPQFLIGTALPRLGI